jgi:ADP-ribose pyrophosphatase YjhB (NUDIX family)
MQSAIRFNYRVAGILIVDGRVLAHTDPDRESQYWSLPGGHPEPGEAATDALRREMREELALKVEIGRLVWVAENFFTEAGTAYHELGLYFLMTLPGTPSIIGREGSFKAEGHDSAHLDFAWLPLDSLEARGLTPAFLRQGLRALPPNTAHVIQVDDV